jgi:hypothetical protein
MTSVRIFDPAMCCSTGVCGPSVDPQLARFSADLDWLKAQGVSVERFNLSQQPAAFAEDLAVRSALETNGVAGLPVVKVNSEIKSSGLYPSRAELAGWAGIARPAPRLPVMLTTASSGCCPTASDERSDERPSTKSSRCC